MTNATFNSRFIGFGGYSEGAADDFNKMLWSALYLEPELGASAVLDQYARYFLGGSATTILAAGLLANLERNWAGNPAVNKDVLESLAAAQVFTSTMSTQSKVIDVHALLFTHLT